MLRLKLYTFRYPAEALTREQALKGMTLDAAFASFSEQERGSLEAGKAADFVILDKNIMDSRLSMAEVLKTQVLQTVVNGVRVFQPDSP